jgi:hypothetical protein
MMAGAGGAAVDVVSPSSILLCHDRMLGGDGGGRCLRSAAREAAGAVSAVAFGSSSRLGRRLSGMLLVGVQMRQVGIVRIEGR